MRIDLAGIHFGRLVVLKFSHNTRYRKSTHSSWDCLCDCGTTLIVGRANLISGRARSCGCSRRNSPIMGQGTLTHGDTVNHSPTPEYKVWQGMWQRCTNPHDGKFYLYGGRGISVCERWNSFEMFLADMGRRPSPTHSIDRLKNDRGYSPDNCRWATILEQRYNRRDYIAVHGEERANLPQV